MRKLGKMTGLAFAIGCALVSQVATAAPVTYNFSFVTQSTNGEPSSGDASGTLQVDGGNIIGIAGTDTLFGNITGLLPVSGFLGNDNKFASAAPFLDAAGVSFSTAGGMNLNLFLQGGPQPFVLQGLQPTALGPFSQGTFTASVSAVPEPGTTGMVAAGLVVLVAFSRRNRRSDNTWSAPAVV